MKVFLSGATGFVGSHLLKRLLRDGYEVRALARRRSSGLAEPAPGSGSLEWIEGDVLSPNVDFAIAGCDAVVNLVGIIREHGKQTFEAVHHQATRNLVAAALRSGVQLFVQMSALGARSENASRYHVTKFAAEQEVRRSGLPHVILRPSLIFGPGSAFLDQMVGVMRAIPLVRPVPGTGKYRFRPVHVDDVVECFVQSLSNSAARGQAIDLVGAEELTLDNITSEIAACLGVHKTVIHIPIPLMRTTARLFSILPVTPPITPDQVRMLEEGSTASPEPMQRIFGINPIAFRPGLRQSLPC
ncbi:MAG: complex I NDUFA9 subunit family protein [Terriglobales bacterium]|jgi:NADH dehydrogenase